MNPFTCSALLDCDGICSNQSEKCNGTSVVVENMVFIRGIRKSSFWLAQRFLFSVPNVFAIHCFAKLSAAAPLLCYTFVAATRSTKKIIKIVLQPSLFLQGLSRSGYARGRGGGLRFCQKG